MVSIGIWDRRQKKVEEEGGEGMGKAKLELLFYSIKKKKISSSSPASTAQYNDNSIPPPAQRTSKTSKPTIFQFNRHRLVRALHQKPARQYTISINSQPNPKPPFPHINHGHIRPETKLKPKPATQRAPKAYRTSFMVAATTATATAAAAAAAELSRVGRVGWAWMDINHSSVLVARSCRLLVVLLACWLAAGVGPSFLPAIWKRCGRPPC